MRPGCPTTVTRLKAAWEAESDAWSERSQAGEHDVAVRADGVPFNIRLDGDRQCILVLMGATADGKEVADAERIEPPSGRDLGGGVRRRDRGEGRCLTHLRPHHWTIARPQPGVAEHPVDVGPDPTLTPDLHQKSGRREKVSVAAAVWLSPRRDHLGLFFKTIVNGYFVRINQMRRSSGMDRHHLGNPGLQQGKGKETHSVRGLLRQRCPVRWELLPPWGRCSE